MSEVPLYMWHLVHCCRVAAHEGEQSANSPIGLSRPPTCLTKAEGGGGGGNLHVLPAPVYQDGWEVEGIVRSNICHTLDARLCTGPVPCNFTVYCIIHKGRERSPQRGSSMQSPREGWKSSAGESHNR